MRGLAPACRDSDRAERPVPAGGVTCCVSSVWMLPEDFFFLHTSLFISVPLCN